MNWRTPARIFLIPVVLILLVFLVWDLIIRIFNVEPFVAPSPGEALGALRDNWSILWPLAIETIRETVYGFVLRAVLGFVLAVAMVQTRIVQGLVYPVLITSQAVPIIAIAAPLVILLDFGIWPKIVIVAWIVFFPVAVSMLHGLANVDDDLIKLAHVMGGTRSRVFFKIRLSATASPLYSGLKIAANGVDVEVIFPPDPASATKILANGDCNLGLITTSDMAFAVKSSLPVISIGNSTTGNNWGLFTKPGVTIGLDTLKGKKISTYGDSWTNAMLPFVLKVAGLTDKEVEQVIVDWDLPLLLNGKVDIATNTTNFLIPGVRDKTGKDPEWILARDNGAPNTPVWVYAGNKDWLAKNPAAAKGFLAAIAQATEWAGANPDEAATLYEKAHSDNGYSHEYNVIGWTKTFTFKKNNDGSLLTQSDEKWMQLGDALKGIGQLDTVAEPSAYYTNEYLPTKWENREGLCRLIALRI